MNTVKIGDNFENICFKIISNSLKKQEIGLIPKQCKVFKKKGYYSRDREKEIIFDLSVEVWPPQAEKYSLLYLIECKDYSSKPVPVDDIEEFYAKIIQVTGANTKAVFITSNTFQSGAYTYANSRGMMLIEVNENLSYNIVLHKTKRYNESLLESNFKSIDSSLLSYKLKLQLTTRQEYRKIDRLILIGFINHLKQKNWEKVDTSLTRYSTEHIEEITTQLLQTFDSNCISEERSPRLDKILLNIKKVFDLTISHEPIEQKDKKKRPILSSCSFLEKKISIDLSIVDTIRYNFILFHELGHFFLHNKIQLNQDAYERLDDSTHSFCLDKYLLNNERNWIEWQANQFAASMLMPKQIIFKHFTMIQDKIGLRPGSQLYVDDQKCNQDSFHQITRYLSMIFQTSKTSVIYRLNTLNLLKENYRAKNITQIMKDIMDDMK